MNRVLVTGAAGFVGRQVSDELARRGFAVYGVSRQSRQIRNLQWRKLDLFDQQAVEETLADVQPAQLVHLAWITTPGDYWGSPRNADWLDASVGLLRSFVDHGGKRALLAGSCAEYDWRNEVCKEGVTPCKAESRYAAAKIALHDLAFRLAGERNFELVWARLFFPYGPREQSARLVPSVIRNLLAGRRAACSDGEQLRDFMYVKDVANALATVLEKDFTGDINIGSGHGTAVKDIVNTIAGQLGAEDLVDFGKLPRRQGEPERLVADVTRLRDIVGWQPDYDLQAAIAETIQWWREQDN